MGFFEKLRRKTERAPDRSFDQRFWAKFEGEFGEKRASFAQGFWRWAQPVAVAAALALVVVYGWGFRAARVLEEQAEQVQILADQELIENYEVLSALEEPALADLDEDEWELLLAEGSDAL